MKRPAVLLILGLALFGPRALADGFSFGGLSLKTTVEDVRNRYPRSSLAGNYLYVSEADTHDHIYGIEIPDGSPAGRLRLTFERPQAGGVDGVARYPACESVLAALRSRYGSPGKVEEFAEERAWNRRLTWTRRGEVLVLHCFRLDPKTFLAEALSITRSPR